MLRRITSVFAVVWVGFTLAGCASSLKVKVLQPAAVNFGAAKKISIVQSEGRRSAREVVINEVVSQSRGAGYFTVQDRTEEGITVKIAGRSVDVTGGKMAQVPDEIYVRLDVIDWNANKDTKTETKTDSKGAKYETTETVLKGKVVLGITASNAQNKALVAEKEYVATFDGDKNDSEEKVLAAAARMAISKFLNDVTPSYVERKIRLDDDDEAQKQYIEVAKGGNIPKALEDLRAYVASNPNNTAGLYNLAVLLDATGQYEEALDAYTKAIAGSTKDYYVEMKTDCAKRLADRQAMAQ
jgi:hypothetical protein